MRCLKKLASCTDKEEEEISSYQERLSAGENPRDIKIILATEIVTIYHNELLASKAKNNFVEVYQNGGVPDDMPELIANDTDTVSDLLLKINLIESKSEWKRLVEQGGVTLNDETLSDYKSFAQNGVYKLGKKRFVKIKV